MEETDDPNKASIDSALLKSKFYAAPREHLIGDFEDPDLEAIDTSSFNNEIK
jgi:hypothetical protein